MSSSRTREAAPAGSGGPAESRSGGAGSAPIPTGRNFRSAFADLRRGWDQRELWLHLGWQDIRQRYRRSVLGPIWITISMAVTAIALGILYSGLFGIELATLLPHVLVGMIVWAFISGCITEGSEVFVANTGLITHLPAPISIHVYRLVWRQTLFFAHNLIVYAVMLVAFPQPLRWTDLSAFLAMALLIVNGTWVALLIGIVSTRFRDLPPVTQSLVQLLFFLTPIVWMYDVLLDNPAVAERARLVELNPLFHFVEIIRRPMLGQDQEWRTWIIVGGIAAVGWAVTLLVMRRYRSRVAYWV
ncbi:galactan export ABC transporter permease subunit Wzm/RfbD [Blastococcus atacamensis]|uniref:galactan export ABC transporter permease subunit Wzm/RfbD n=1 Tax=Blastococcus atacamensis TaxID=2070508 RepID=UPI000CEBE92E|nr:ABC transporter permease [Blastococcus atacamensis]